MSVGVKALLLTATTVTCALSSSVRAFAEETRPLVFARAGEPPPPPRKRVRLVTGGSLLLGIPYSLGLTGDAVNTLGNGPKRYNWLLLPGGGPLVLMAETTNAPGNIILALDAVAQISGIAMLSYAIASPVPVAEESTPTVSFIPLLGGGRAGIGVVGRF
jgi:hypothetical protein